MKFRIFINSDGDKELEVGGEFVATWSKGVDDTEVILPVALDVAFNLGKTTKQKELQNVLGI